MASTSKFTSKRVTKSKRKKGKSAHKKRVTGRRRMAEFQIYQFAGQLRICLERYFPDLIAQLDLAPDQRKYFEYSPGELIMGCICMFLLRAGSRNEMNQDSTQSQFRKNYRQLFHLEIAHLDTINIFLEKLPDTFLEQVKQQMLSCLFKRKVFHKFRLFDYYHLIAIDGVCLNTSDNEPYPGCPFRQYATGKVYLVWTLEAKLVCPNGFCISIGTQWLLNKSEYDKQDCEKKAFDLLCNKLRETYPQLPICITTDGLFIGEPNLKLCKDLNFRYIFTIKDGCISSIWSDFFVRKIIEQQTNSQEQRFKTKSQIVNREMFYTNKIKYKGFEINMMECIETTCTTKEQNITKKTFCYVTDFVINQLNLQTLIHCGRLRWKIENEGFNAQKNGGYALKHKYNRNNLQAHKNYYQCLQIAHMIDQLYTLCEMTKKLMGKYTAIWVWKTLRYFLLFGQMPVQPSDQLEGKKQYIYL